MAPSNFHLFPQLPCELRLQIWESAIRRRPTSSVSAQDLAKWNAPDDEVKREPTIRDIPTNGVHYVKLSSEGEFIPLNGSWETPHFDNRSVYLWHAGLWMACRESRKVMLKYWFDDPCYTIESVNYLENGGYRKWFFGDRYDPDVIWNLGRDQGDYGPWLMVTFPGDMFCITPDGWNPLTRLMGSRRNADHLAVEFDQSWTFELMRRENHLPIKTLSSTLAFFLKICFEIAAYNPDLPLNIHLIDRHSHWRNVRSANPVVFYDCKHEYIRINLSDTHGSNRIIRHAPVLRFLDQVDRLVKNTLTYKRRMSRHNHRGDRRQAEALSVRELVRVMVRVDKKLAPETTKRSAPRRNVNGRSVTESSTRAITRKPAVRGTTVARAVR
ncbi:hypothetical protein IL306_010240 [Fusarium sp. DS 682]|nr:hypothetical protein IL306_010240 [Fusarium sp. DS 682]